MNSKADGDDFDENDDVEAIKSANILWKPSNKAKLISILFGLICTTNLLSKSEMLYEWFLRSEEIFKSRYLVEFECVDKSYYQFYFDL